MKRSILLAALLVFAAGVCAQEQRTAPAQESLTIRQSPLLPPESPLYHLTSLAKAARVRRPYNCVQTKYYSNSGSQHTYTDTVPSSVWAVKFTPPPFPNNICTVWTVTLRYTWLPDSLGVDDTLHFTMREVSGSYAQFYSGFFIPKIGDNFGDIEIDPPIFPNFQIPKINPKREFYFTWQMKGEAGADVIWYLKSPASFSSRSYKFTTPSTLADASTVVGTSVDHEFAAFICCEYGVIPVEVSVFNASLQGSSVELAWKTESETNNYGFEVQRAMTQEGPWENRGFVAGKGTTNEPQWYAFVDPLEPEYREAGSPPAMWYRLKQYDYDGTSEEMRPIQVLLSSPEQSGYALLGNYPNPVTTIGDGYTTFRFQIPEDNDVRLSVHDGLGREVATILDGPRKAGYHEAVWRLGTSLGSMNTGTYFVIMKAGSYQAMRKFTVIR